MKDNHGDTEAAEKILRREIQFFEVFSVLCVSVVKNGCELLGGLILELVCTRHQANDSA